MIAYYYIPATLLFFGILLLMQVQQAVFFILGLQLISLALIFSCHFFALDAENVLYFGLLLFGFTSFVQSSFSLNHLKKALLDEPDAK